MKTSIVIVMMCLVATSYCQFSSLKDALQKRDYSDSLASKKPIWTIESLIQNFLQGSKLNTIISESEDCVNANVYLLGNVSNAFHEYAKKPSVNNFFGITQAFGNFTPAVKFCFGSSVEASEAIFTHLKQFGTIKKFFSALIVNVENELLIFGIQVNNLKNLLFAGDYNKFSFAWGEFLNKLVDFQPMMRQSLSSPQVGDFAVNAQDFFDGVVEGTVIFKTDNILQCFNQTRWYTESFELALKNFEKGTEQGFKDGWFAIADSFSHIYPVAFNCWKGEEDFFIQFYKHTDLRNPLEALFRFTRNFEFIYKGIIPAFKLLDQAKYMESGNMFGEIIFRAFFQPGN